jgi:hypothetical protein
MVKLYRVEEGDKSFQGVVIYTDDIEGNEYSVLSPGTPVVILAEKETNKHFCDSPIMIRWAYVMSPKGFGWVWKMYLEEVT